MKMRLKSKRIRTLEELWAIEDEFPAVCGPNPVLYAARHGLKLSKSNMKHLRGRKADGIGTKPSSRRRKAAVA